MPSLRTTRGRITGPFIGSVVILLVLLAGALSTVLAERKERLETAHLRQEILDLGKETSALEAELGELGTTSDETL